MIRQFPLPVVVAAAEVAAAEVAVGAVRPGVAEFRLA